MSYKKPHRATKSVDFVIVDESQVTVAIQVIPKYHAEEVKENCHAMKLLGPDYRKIIVTEPDEETINKIRYNCPDNVDVMDIISFLGRQKTKNKKAAVNEVQFGDRAHIQRNAK